MTGITIVQTLIAVLAFLPLAFVLAACGLEIVSAAKKSRRHQPGGTALLSGAAGFSLLCIAANIVLPLQTKSEPDGLWPLSAPTWSGVFGIASALAVIGTSTFRLYLEKNGERLPPKKKKDFEMGFAFLLAATALVLFAGAVFFSGGGGLGSMLAFLPAGFLLAALYLEIMSCARSPEPYQPAIIAVLFGTVSLVSLAVGCAAFGAGPSGFGEMEIGLESHAPAWFSPWGVATLLFVGLAYLAKLAARKSILSARESSTGVFQTPRQRLKALAVRPSPAPYVLALTVSLPLLALVHLRLFTSEEGFLASAENLRQSVSKSVGSVKDFTAGAQPSESTVDRYAAVEGSVGSILSSPPQPETGETVETPFEDGSTTEVETVEPLDMSGTSEIDGPPEPVADIPEISEGEEEGEIPAMAMTGVTNEAPDAEQAALNVAAIKPYDDGKYFVSQVQPIFTKHCYDCHSTKKKKGGLQLHSATAIRAGADSGSVLIAGNPERSPVYTMTTLGKNDPDVMPSKGDLLSMKEQAILKKWILDGAHMDDGEISSAIATSGNSGNFLIDQQAANISPPNASVIQALAQSGVQFRALSGNGALIKVDFSHGERGRPALEDLEAISENIYHLDLSRTAVADDDLAVVATFPFLHRLELSHTKIGDEGIKHLASLKYLNTLNLYNTGVGPEGLEALHGVTTLEKIYAFGSRISETSAEAAQAKIKGLKVLVE